MLTPQSLVSVGAGGFGRETLDVIDAINAAGDGPAWRLLGVLDDQPAEEDRRRLNRRGVPLLGPVEHWLSHHPPSYYVLGVGKPEARWRLSARFDEHGHRAATLIHPSVIRGFGTSYAAGVVVCAGVQISTEVQLGAHTHVNPGAILGHDSITEDFVSINPGAVISGACRIEQGVLLGAGSVVLQGIRIGAGAVVGAAACVTRDVRPGTTVKGVPAR